jgi:hypothetical protein
MLTGHKVPCCHVNDRVYCVGENEVGASMRECISLISGTV